MELDASKIKEILERLGFDFVEKRGTIYTTCPGCGESDKLSIKKTGRGTGSTICYRGSCSFGGPRPFFEWVMLSGNMTREQAVQMVHAEVVLPAAPEEGYRFKLGSQKKEKVQDPLVPILWPLAGSYPVTVPEAGEGIHYLLSRGIPIGLAHAAGIHYSPATRRVVFPIQMNGMVYGWQGRAIDQVSPGERMRNNPGFERARCVMFLDSVQLGGHAIIAEGPFDALKFARCGGFVSTMGKVVSQAQLDLVMSRTPSSIYLALDDDAVVEMRKLRSRITVPVFRIKLPQSAVSRCAAAGRKADFGECTLDECVEAFRYAVPFDRHVEVYLKQEST